MRLPKITFSIAGSLTFGGNMRVTGMASPRIHRGFALRELFKPASDGGLSSLQQYAPAAPACQEKFPGNLNPANYLNLIDANNNLIDAIDATARDFARARNAPLAKPQ
jgi:hypothetical protein